MIRDHAAAQMKRAQRESDEDAPEDYTEKAAGPGFLVAHELRLLDGTIAFLQHWRNRIAPPEEEDDHRHGSRRATFHDEPAAAAAAPAKPRRLRSFLLVVAALLSGGLAGMEFSYSALSRIIDTQDMLIEDLRDGIGRLQKQDARNINAAARYQQKLEEEDMKLKEYRQQVADYEAQIEELRAQVRAASPPPRVPATRQAVGSASRYQRPAPEKTGKCVMGTANAAADLTRCVEQFNR